MARSRREGRVRRHNRVRRKIRGNRARPRLAVYRSNRYIYAQVIDDEAGTTLAAASSQEAPLRERTLTVETAAEVGTLIGERAADAGISTVVLDRGGYRFHGRLKALADAARDAGLEF